MRRFSPGTASARSSLLLCAALLLSCAKPAPPTTPGCAACHRATGLEPAHASLSCDACHGGQPDAGTLPGAHAGLVKTPGNFDDMAATCGAATCHPAVPLRLRNNIMATLAGVVSVDRWVFGEQPTPTGGGGLPSLADSAADTHLRNLCASCHLGRRKREYGPVGESSRGGGCNACHLRYPQTARDDLARLEAASPAQRGTVLARFAHPQLRAKVPDESCFGCHSRSGRISLNVLGLREADGDAGTPVRTLEDGRHLFAAPGDIHHERGLGCTDCHGSWEVMGDGRATQHREDQSFLECTDCHRTSPPTLVPVSGLDQESQRLARTLGFDVGQRRTPLMRRAPYPVLGAHEVDGGLAFTGRFSGREYPLRPPSPACLGVHARVGCPACHDAWAPQCVSCHTRFDANEVRYDWRDDAEAPGAWLETGGPVFAEPGALGARELSDGGVRFEAFIPGMILTIDRGDGGLSFQRLYAPIAAHTTRREARSCTGCHADSLALGWGRGALTFSPRGPSLEAHFTPRFPLRPEDGLPQDAWVAPFTRRGSEATTRSNTRPLSPLEQRRVLAVGVCLSCHRPDTPWLRESVPTPTSRCRTLR